MIGKDEIEHRFGFHKATIEGENEDGITLFIPKDLQGEFHLTENDTFLSLIFVRADGRGGMMPWTPWADGPVLKS